MTNSTKFNEALFNTISSNNNNQLTGIEAVLNVLSQRSDRARTDSLNHNCQISGLPFCWDYYYGYGEDAEQIKVISFPMTKISTGWSFVLDIEESGRVYISEGKGTRRTLIKTADLNAFSFTTMESIRSVLEYMLNSNTEFTPDAEEIFYFYKQVLSDSSSLIKTTYRKWDSETNSMYKKIMIEGIQDSAHFEYEKNWESPNPYDDAIASEPKKHILIASWSKEHKCWYIDFVFDDSAWGFSCLREPGTYRVLEFKDSALHTPAGVEEAGSYHTITAGNDLLIADIYDDDALNRGEYVIDKECMMMKISPDMQDEIMHFVSNIVGNHGDAKEGAWFGYKEDREGCWMKSCRKWTEIPENKRIHLYVAPSCIAKYYDDVEELDFSPENGDEENPDMARIIEGSCRFKYHHPTDEEDEDDQAVID